MNLALKEFALILICHLSFFLPHSSLVLAQSRNLGRVLLKVTVKDKDQATHLVQNFGLLVQKLSDTSPEAVISSTRVSTTPEGAASIVLLPGNYVVKSEKPLVVKEKVYEWSVPLKVELRKPNILELSNDNATVTQASTALKQGRITDEEDLLNLLGDGVVTVEGELGHGTGFIIDDKGLILTNQHLISNSKELRVQFDRERKVQAKLLAEDLDKDLAVLWVSLNPCSDCQSLTLRKQGVDQISPAAGERVFTITSPLAQGKSLTSSIIKGVDDHAIISDSNITPGNSGGPLFNMRGEVVGINCFSDQEHGGSSASRIVRIEDAQKLFEKAKAVMEGAPARSPSQLLPVEPITSYPIEGLKTKVDIKRFEDKPYKADVGKYQITMITPVLKYYIVEKDRIKLARQQAKDKKNETNTGTQSGAINSFYNLRNWAEYVSQVKPVVHVLAIPEVKATGKSLFFGVLAAGVGAMGGSPVLSPLDFKFKADFEEMLLMCDGKPIIPIQRGKIEYIAPMQSYFKIKTRSAYAGIYTYSSEAFNPGRCKQLELQVFSKENPTAPEKKLIDPKSVQKVWGDFDAYQRQMMSK